MEFGILGTLEVHCGGRAVEVGGRKVRMLLAALVVHAGRAVSKDRLVDILWGPAAPDAAPTTLQSHVAHLRAALQPGRGRHEPGVLVRRDPGYMLDVDAAAAIDAGRFERLAAEGREALAGGDADRAARRLQAALALWRGEALADFTFEPFAQGEIARLTELQLVTVEDRVDADLAIGKHGEVTTELRGLVLEQPLRERFWGQLMLALYRGRRQVDALRAFAEFRQLLAEQVGLDPSSELVRLEEAILRQEPGLDLPPGNLEGSRAPDFRAAPVVVAAQLPLRPSHEEMVEAGREAWRRRAWERAFELLSAVEQAGLLPPDQLPMLADAAFWTGRSSQFIRIYERIHGACVAVDDHRGAALSALVIAVAHAFRLRLAVAGGWFAVATKMLETEPDCVEHGYMAWAMGTVLIVTGSDDPGAVLDQADQVLKWAELSGDRDLHAVGLTYRGYILAHQGYLADGLPLLDEAMANVATGTVGPLATAAVICRTLSTCVDLHDYARATDWLRAVEQCSREHGLIGFPGDCRMHQAQLLLARGAWADAEALARLACAEMDDFVREHTGLAFYILGEVLRLKGDLPGATAAYARADELGRSPQPGLALLHLSGGDVESATASLRQALELEQWNVLGRSRLLAAKVDIALAAGDLPAAGAAAGELSTLAAGFPTVGLAATSHYAEGVVALADHRAADAIPVLRLSWRQWREIGVTHEAARARLKLGSALSADGQDAAGRLEVDAALATFEQLGATPDAETARRLAVSLSSKAQ